MEALVSSAPLDKRTKVSGLSRHRLEHHRSELHCLWPKAITKNHSGSNVPFPLTTKLDREDSSHPVSWWGAPALGLQSTLCSLPFSYSFGFVCLLCGHCVSSGTLMSVPSVKGTSHA